MKYRLKHLSFFLLLTLLLGACKKEEPEPEPVELLENSSITSPNFDWQFSYVGNVPGNPNQCDGAYSTDIHSTPPYALKVGCNLTTNKDIFSYWRQSITPPANFPTGKRLLLKAQIRLDNVQGNGIALAMRGDRRGSLSAVFFSSTENKQSIKGTSDFKEYTLEVDAYSGPVDQIHVFLIYLRNTTGTAYFDDISLTAR
jgi:hypothetical protein